MSDRPEVREKARSFAEDEIEPVAAAYDERNEFPEAVVREAARQGFVGLLLPAKYGGSGDDLLASAIVVEEFSRADHSFSFSISSADVGMHLVTRYGDEWMREEWIPKITAGEAFSAMAVTEPDHGSDVAGIESTAEKRGDEWVLNGEKSWVTNGTVADVYVVAAKSDPEAGHRGISFFLVPGGADGISAADMTDEMMGVRASDVGRVTFDDVRVPADNLVGDENGGFYHLLEGSVSTRVIAAAGALGMAQGAADAAVEYARHREQFDQPIGEFQAVQHATAEMTTSVEAIRSLTYRAAAAIEADEDGAERLASAAKLFASEEVLDVTDAALQVHGAAGYLSEYPVERHYRNARVVKIYEGTSEIQKDVIANSVL